jgi:hypothetical protein
VRQVGHLPRADIFCLPSFLYCPVVFLRFFLSLCVLLIYPFITVSASGPNLAAHVKAPSYKIETKAIPALSAMGSKVK